MAVTQAAEVWFSNAFRFTHSLIKTTTGMFAVARSDQGRMKGMVGGKGDPFQASAMWGRLFSLKRDQQKPATNKPPSPVRSPNQLVPGVHRTSSTFSVQAECRGRAPTCNRILLSRGCSQSFPLGRARNTAPAKADAEDECSEPHLQLKHCMVCKCIVRTCVDANSMCFVCMQN